MRLVSARSRVRSSLEAHSLIRHGVVGNISACHADARGSIPRDGVYFLFASRVSCSWCDAVPAAMPRGIGAIGSVRASQARGTGIETQILQILFLHFFRPFRAARVGVPTAGSAGMGYWRNRKRASLARTRYWDRNPDTPFLVLPPSVWSSWL